MAMDGQVLSGWQEKTWQNIARQVLSGWQQMGKCSADVKDSADCQRLLVGRMVKLTALPARLEIQEFVNLGNQKHPREKARIIV